MLEFAAQLIGVAVDDDGPLAERMSKPFPWMLALSEQVLQRVQRVGLALAAESSTQPVTLSGMLLPMPKKTSSASPV